MVCPAMPVSSPHTRGTRRHAGADGSSGRFIPAPRGEHRKGVPFGHGQSGSSPHTRGTPVHARALKPKSRFIPAPRGEHCANGLVLGHCGRFIPAHAGNTMRPPTIVARPSVHPRTRGEHRQPAYCDKMRGGSSPHTRGTHPRRVARAPEFRFIPAHAGNTLSPTI